MEIEMEASVLGSIVRTMWGGYQETKDRETLRGFVDQLRKDVFRSLPETGPWFAIKITVEPGHYAIIAIKALREITGLGLRETMDIVRLGWSLIVTAHAANVVTEHMRMTTLGDDLQIRVEEINAMPGNYHTVNG